MDSNEIENILKLNNELEKLNNKTQSEIDYVSEIISSHEKILWLCDTMNDEILYISPNTQDLLFNITIDELISNRGIWLHSIHPDDRASVEIAYDRRSLREPYDFEYRLKNKKGNYTCVRDRELIIFNPDGSPKYRSGIVEQIAVTRVEKETVEKEWINFKSILDKIWVGLIVIDKTFQVVYANKTCYELVNLIGDDTAEINIFDYIHPDYKQLVQSRAIERMKGGDPENEYEVILIPNKTEKEIWVKIRTLRVRFNDEDVILTTIHNVDQAKRASQKLLESQQNFRAILDHTPYSIFLISPKLELIDFNLTAAKFVKKSTGIELKKYDMFPDYLHKRDKTFYENSFERVLKGEQVVSEEEIWIRSNKKMWLMNRFNPVFNEQNEITGIIYSAIDISQKKSIELELQNNKAHLKALVESSSNLIVYSVDKYYRLTTFNSMFVKWMKQYIGADIQIGNTFLDYAGDEGGLNLSFKNLFDRAIKGEEFNYEFEFSNDNDKKYYDSIYYPVRSSNGKISGVGVYIWDISEEKKLKEELLQSKNDLTKLNASKDKFLSMIAHDLKSPISGLQGMIGSIVEGIDFLNKDEIKEYLVELHHSSKNVYNLLEDLLEWSRASTGKIQFDPDNICLHMLVDSLYSLLSQNAKNKDIELVNKIDKDLYSYCDGNMISTVVRNLVGNSIKFTQSGSVTCLAQEDGDKIIFTVADTGVGIKEKIIDKLFKIDETVTTRGTNDETGTGLGLIMCKEFVEGNGGRIWVESEFGVGSKFIFTIPLMKKFD